MELRDFFKEYPNAAIAFSGGVDSAYLVYAGMRYGARIKAYYMKTAFQPQFELEDAKRLAKELGAELEILHADVLCCQQIASNPANRCYFCKQMIFTEIWNAAKRDGFSVVLDGTNASDDISQRPGVQALEEMGVRSPLREAGLTKQEIRRLSQEAGLFTWNKCAYACLATRIPAGEQITRRKLEMTESAEAELAELGMQDFRVRYRDGGALIQGRREDLNILLEHREELVRKWKNNYRFVYLDMEVRDGD